MLRVVSHNGRRVLSVSCARSANVGIHVQQYVPMNDVHVVNQPDHMVYQDNPDYNLHYFESPHDSFPIRPFMLGRKGTPLAALREKEQGSWHDLTFSEKVTVL